MIKTLEIANAVAILRAGGLVAFPTETVYGLGADATHAAAVRRIFVVKERPYDHPLIVHLANKEQLGDWVQEVSPEAWMLAQAFWPGPLTMVLKKQPFILDMVTGGQETVGVRVPSHPLAHALLSAFGGGIVAPSANRFTHISPTTAAAVREELDEKVDLILDGGACSVGLESTIIDMSSHMPVILRPGMITMAAISAVLNRPISMRRQDAPAVRAPGMHHLHYAPTTKTVLMTTQILAHFLQGLEAKDLPVAVVLHSDVAMPNKSHIHPIKLSTNASAYAHDLYHTLRSLDHQQFKQIVIEEVPKEAEWEAIRDRISKATAER